MSQSAFTDGPSLADGTALLAWLDGEGAGRRLRLPVVIKPSVLGLASGHIGTVAAAPGPDAIHVRLDDTAMSVSLADRVRSDCPDGEYSVIWAEGVWGATLGGGPSLGGPSVGGPALGGPGLLDEPTRHPFSVRDYAGRVDGAPSHIQVASN